jgi:hypothetical protein
MRSSPGKILAIVYLLAAGACGAASRSLETATPKTFELVGVNPFAAAQPTAQGRRLHTLAGWRNELYVGYGDYGANTGPIEISAWDPPRRAFSAKLSFDTEAVEIYRAIGDRLYAPAIDPRGSGQSASVAVGEPDGRWWNNRNVFFTHAYDIASLDGADLWLVGSRGREAVAARSTDGGLTWTTALTVSPHSNGIARFYFVFAYGGQLTVQAEDTVRGQHPHSRVFMNGHWTDGPDLQPLPGVTCKPLSFAGRIVYRGRAGLMVYDGTTVELAGPDVDDLVVDGPMLYVLTSGLILRTADLMGWNTVAVAPAGASSLGVLDGQLYVGTADAALYRLSGRPSR